jgi:hypothetical protein
VHVSDMDSGEHTEHPILWPANRYDATDFDASACFNQTARKKAPLEGAEQLSLCVHRRHGRKCNAAQNIEEPSRLGWRKVHMMLRVPPGRIR